MGGPRICFVSDTIHTYLGSSNVRGAGGAERQQYLLAEQLCERGHSIAVATLNIETVHDERFDVYPCIPDVRGVIGAPYKLIHVVNCLRRIDADIYYVRGNDFLCLATALATQLAGGRFVYAVANDADVEPAYWNARSNLLHRLYLRSLRSADAVTTLTDHQRRVLSDCYGINARVIPCGYNLPNSSEVVEASEREYVLWVGRMDPDQKKPMRFVDLARSLPEEQFLMIGPSDNDEPEHAEIVRRAASEVKNLEYLGFIDPDDIHDYFRRAKLLVNTSDYEGFGNIFLEAWRYETPVISLHYTLDGLIPESDAGVHAEGRVSKLRTVVAELKSDPEMRSRMGAAGRELVESEFTLSTVVDDYEILFAELI